MPFLGVYLKEIKSQCQRNTCAPRNIVALFRTVKKWNQSTCLLADEWINKMLHVHNRILSTHSQKE